MKKPKIKVFDSSHPIWDEAKTYYEQNDQTVGVFSSKYGNKNKAFCAACNWHGTADEYEKNNFICPICGSADIGDWHMSKRDGTLIIDEIDGIIVFRFIGFEFTVNENGKVFSASEEYRIYTDEKEYLFCKRSGNTFVNLSRAEMDSKAYFRDRDMYEYHNYDGYVQNNPFIKKLDILYDTRATLETIFSTIATSAAKNIIGTTCPKFIEPLPSTNYLLSTNYKDVDYAENVIRSQKIGNAIRFDIWCGKCGSYIESVSKYSPYGNNPYVKCSCSDRNISHERTSNNTGGHFIIDVQKEKDCTVLRFTEFYVISSVDKINVTVGQKAKTILSARIGNVYYVCCYNDGKVLIFDSNYEPMTHFDSQDTHFADNCVNEKLDEILNDENIAKTGFSDFYKMHDSASIFYFFGYNRTEIAQKLINSNLHSLIYTLSYTKDKVPAYLLKDNNKFDETLFSDEHKEDFALHFIDMSLFVVYMQIFKKDNTITYSDYNLLASTSNKSYIAEIYRRIPNVKSNDIMQYISDINLEEALGPSESIQLWCSYLNNASKLGLDLSDKKIAYPKSLKREYDLICRAMRENIYSETDKLNYMQIAQKLDIHYEDENYCVDIIKDRDEYISLKNSIMNTQREWNTISPYRFSLKVFSKKRNMTKYIIDIDGVFSGDKLLSGDLVSVLGFGNSVDYGRYRYGKVIAANALLVQVFNELNIY